jgi:hypothetical protein
MYLGLRIKDIDLEDEVSGQTVFEIYLKRNDIDCLKLLLIRGSNINYINKNTLLTPLH